MASRKYAFNALPPVKAKGYAEPVPIFEPLSPLERSWGRIQPNFVGREQEIKAMMGMARDIVSQEEPQSRLVFVASQSGMGKSTMVAHAIEHIRNYIGDNARRLVITKHVGKESHSLLPFGYVLWLVSLKYCCYPSRQKNLTYCALNASAGCFVQFYLTYWRTLLPARTTNLKHLVLRV